MGWIDYQNQKHIDPSYIQNRLRHTMNQILYELINTILKDRRIPFPKDSNIVYSSHYLARKIVLFVIPSLVPYLLAV